MTSASAPGEAPLWLERSPDRAAEIDALAAQLGPRVGLGHVARHLKFSLRPHRLPRSLGTAVTKAFSWQAHDRNDPVWWPQGITSSADADASQRFEGRRLLLTTWYAKPVDGVARGARVSLVDLDTLRYRHVLLVEAATGKDGNVEMKPVKIHAGGIVWNGPWVHVAATARGFHTFHVDDVMRVPDDNRRPLSMGVDSPVGGSPTSTASFGHHYVWPMRHRHVAGTAEGVEKLRYSFLSLDRQNRGLVVGEYGREEQTRRLRRFDLTAGGEVAFDSDGRARPHDLGDGVRQMQGVLVIDGRHYLSSSRGTRVGGSVLSGAPGAWKEHALAMPPGPEDLSHWPGEDLLWSVSEHPGKRWIYAMHRSTFD